MDMILESEINIAKACAKSMDWYDALNHLVQAVRRAEHMYADDWPDDVDEAISRTVGAIGAEISMKTLFLPDFKKKKKPEPKACPGWQCSLCGGRGWIPVFGSRGRTPCPRCGPRFGRTAIGRLPGSVKY